MVNMTGEKELQHPARPSERTSIEDYITKHVCREWHDQGQIETLEGKQADLIGLVTRLIRWVSTRATDEELTEILGLEYNPHFEVAPSHAEAEDENEEEEQDLA